jgi:hypothetical protein
MSIIGVRKSRTAGAPAGSSYYARCENKVFERPVNPRDDHICMPDPLGLGMPPWFHDIETDVLSISAEIGAWR